MYHYHVVGIVPIYIFYIFYRYQILLTNKNISTIIHSNDIETYTFNSLYNLIDSNF